MIESITKSVTSWQAERDSLLDRISHLQDARERASAFIATLVEAREPITPFDLTEMTKILWETPAESEARRFPEPVLDSVFLEQKEDQK
jgi:Fic family protein